MRSRIFDEEEISKKIIFLRDKEFFTLLYYKNPQKIPQKCAINSLKSIFHSIEFHRTNFNQRCNLKLLPRRYEKKKCPFFFNKFVGRSFRLTMTGEEEGGKKEGGRGHRLISLDKQQKPGRNHPLYLGLGKGLFLAGGVFRYVLQRRSGVRGPLYPIIIASQQRFSFPSSTAGRLPFISFYPPERASVSEVFPPPATVLKPGT